MSFYIEKHNKSLYSRKKVNFLRNTEKMRLNNFFFKNFYKFRYGRLIARQKVLYDMKYSVTQLLEDATNF